MSTAAPHPGPLSAANAPLPTAEQLPDDPDTLKRLIVELLATLRQERQDKEQLQQRLHLLVQRLYGRSREHFHPNQPLLFADADEAAPAEPANEPAPAPPAKRRCRPHGRRRLPDHLPRREVHHELSEAERVCVCGQRRIDIGTESGGEQLDWQPASYFVWQHLIHKYLCPHCAGQTKEANPPTGAPAADPADRTPLAAAEGMPPSTESIAIGPAIASAPKPPQPIAKGLPGPGLLAHIIVSKYFDHLPLYRQERIFERQGVVLTRSTTCDWMAACADLLRPLYDLLVSLVLQSRWLHTDDTPVLNRGHAPGTTDQGRFWIYAGDRDHPYHVFDFTVNRKRDGPATFLAGFHGYLQADAFSGYDALYLPQPRAGQAPIIEVACNAHARRKFYEAKGSDALRAHQALAYYSQLYDLERAARENHFDDEQRLRLRQELALPVLEKFKAWLEEQRAGVLPKSPMAEAIGYALHNWEALIRYTEAGFLSIDNNVAEREMKRIALGRKNWLFVGSATGGRTAAVLFSFTATCHRLAIEPWAYLQDVLTRLPTTPPDRLPELLPDCWQAARQAAVPPPSSPAAKPPPDPA